MEGDVYVTREERAHNPPRRRSTAIPHTIGGRIKGETHNWGWFEYRGSRTLELDISTLLKNGDFPGAGKKTTEFVVG